VNSATVQRMTPAAPRARSALGTIRTIVPGRQRVKRARVGDCESTTMHGVLIGRSADAREKAWMRLDVARRYTDSTAIKICGRARTDVTLSKNLVINGLLSCKSPQRCPRCAERIAVPRRNALQTATAAWIAGGKKIALVTLTMAHGKAQPLAETLNAVLQAWSLMFQGRARHSWHALGMVAAIRTLEATHGARNGWHPHIHALMFLESDCDVKALESHVTEAWNKRVKCNEHGVRVDACVAPEAAARYVAKGVANETIMGHEKSASSGRVHPFQLLDVRSERARRLWREWEAAVKGRRCHGWIGKAALVAIVGPIAWTDDGEPLKDADDKPRPRLELSRDTWNDLVRLRAVALLLAILRQGLDVSMLLAYDRARRAEYDADLNLLRLCLRRC